MCRFASLLVFVSVIKSEESPLWYPYGPYNFGFLVLFNHKIEKGVHCSVIYPCIYDKSRLFHGYVVELVIYLGVKSSSGV